MGAGVAGVEAAAALRSRDGDCRVRIVGAEPTPFYARIRLPEVLAGRTDPSRLVLRTPDWYREHRLDLLTGVRVEALDPAQARVRLSSGEWVAYDALLLATGATPFVPPVPGVDLEGVFTLRSLEDALRLRERAHASSRAVVIGGGLLGIEAAAALRPLGVVVVEAAPWLLPRQLDRGGAAVVQQVLQARGLEFRLGAKVLGITGPGRVQAVSLASGEELPADLVLVAAGVRPETSLARDAGLDVGRGIRVDDRMATSSPGVYAAGDCAEHGGRLYGIWPAAEAQGRTAGAAMAGEDPRYQGTVPSNTLKVTDLPVFSAGDVDPAGAVESEVTTGEGRYRKLVRDREGRLVGAILIGDLRERRAVLDAVTTGAPFVAAPGGASGKEGP